MGRDRSLLLSRDEKAQGVLCALLGEMRIEVEVATDVRKAVQLLGERKFEALLIDCEMQGAGSVLQDIASYRSGLGGQPRSSWDTFS
jgi:DNA-binding response OmpR family regulator